MATLKRHLNKVNSYWKWPSQKLRLKPSSTMISPGMFVDKAKTGHSDPDSGSSIFYLSFESVSTIALLLFSSLPDLKTISD